MPLGGLAGEVARFRLLGCKIIVHNLDDFLVGIFLFRWFLGVSARLVEGLSLLSGLGLARLGLARLGLARLGGGQAKGVVGSGEQCGHFWGLRGRICSREYGYTKFGPGTF